EACVEWAGNNIAVLLAPRARESSEIPLRCEYRGSGGARHMKMQSASTGIISQSRLPNHYLPDVKTTLAVETPIAYGVPARLGGVLEVLARHRFVSDSAGAFSALRMERYRIESVIPASLEDESPLPICVREWAPVSDEFVIFPTAQPG